jgi:putative transposase
MEITSPRDSEFEPQLIKKNQTTLSGDVEEKTLSMCAKGMSASDIETRIRDI